MPHVSVNGAGTYYEEYGDGEPIVLVHGLEGHHGDWEYQIDELRDEYHVIVYDIRGSGYTGATDEWSYSIEMFAADLHGLVTELGLDAPTIVGYSMGAKVAITYAARYPDDLSTLVFASTSHPDADTGLVPTLLLKGMYVPIQTSLIGLFGWEARETLDEWVGKRVFGDDDTDDDDHDPADEHDAPDEMAARNTGSGIWPVSTGNRMISMSRR